MSLQIENITKTYGAQKALDQVNFSVGKGEIAGFLGPNGAGKSTAMKIITGFIKPDSGNVTINERSINEHGFNFKSKIGYLPEHNPLYLDMYISEYLEFTAKLYHLGQIKEKVKHVILKTGLEKEQNKKIKQLSKGYRQRVGLAAAIIHDPDILILDEPTTGLDPNQIIEIRNLISELGKQKTVLLSTHIMQEVEALCGKVIIINAGKIVASNTVAQISQMQPDDYIFVGAEFDRMPNIELLKQIHGILEIQAIPENKILIKTRSEIDIRPDIFRFAVDNKFTVLSLQRHEKNMEEIFRDLTRK